MRFEDLIVYEWVLDRLLIFYMKLFVLFYLNVMVGLMIFRYDIIS